MKGRIVMAVTIGIICILLSSVMFVQFKSVEVIEKSGVGLMRETELRTEYSATKEKTAEMESQLEEIEKTIEEYTNQSTDNQGMIELLRTDVQKARCDLGYTEVKGPGLIITIQDGPNVENNINERVTYDDLLFAVNELKYAGAEAIAINDQRFVNTTYIKDVGDKVITVDGDRIIPPYVIKVIGDSKYLESVINIRGGVKDTLEAYGKSIEYTSSDEIHLPKYEQTLEIRYGE